MDLPPKQTASEGRRTSKLGGGQRQGGDKQEGNNTSYTTKKKTICIACPDTQDRAIVHHDLSILLVHLPDDSYTDAYPPSMHSKRNETMKRTISKRNETETKRNNRKQLQ